MNGTNSSAKDNLIIKVIAFFSLAIIAFYLVTEHRAHLLAYSSYIIFGVFILMHLFMHSGHGGHGSHGGHGRGSCCGGHNYEEHKHGQTVKTDKETEENIEAHESIGHHEHNQEKSR